MLSALAFWKKQEPAKPVSRPEKKQHDWVEINLDLDEKSVITVNIVPKLSPMQKAWKEFEEHFEEAKKDWDNQLILISEAKRQFLEANRAMSNLKVSNITSDAVIKAREHALETWRMWLQEVKSCIADDQEEIVALQKVKNHENEGQLAWELVVELQTILKPRIEIMNSLNDDFNKIVNAPGLIDYVWNWWSKPAKEADSSLTNVQMRRL